MEGVRVCRLSRILLNKIISWPGRVRSSGDTRRKGEVWLTVDFGPRNPSPYLVIHVNATCGVGVRNISKKMKA